MKKCIKCNVEKTKAEFQMDRQNIEGVRKICKACVNKKRMAKYYEKKNNAFSYF